MHVKFNYDKKNKQEGHDGPGSLTCISLEPNYLKICPLVSQKKLFKAFFLFIALAAILFNRGERFEQFGRQSPKEQSCIVILKSMHWLRRRSCLKVFSFFSSGSHLVQQSGTV